MLGEFDTRDSLLGVAQKRRGFGNRATREAKTESKIHSLNKIIRGERISE